MHAILARMSCVVVAPLARLDARSVVTVPLAGGGQRGGVVACEQDADDQCKYFGFHRMTPLQIGQDHPGCVQITHLMLNGA